VQDLDELCRRGIIQRAAMVSEDKLNNRQTNRWEGLLGVLAVVGSLLHSASVSGGKNATNLVAAAVTAVFTAVAAVVKVRHKWKAGEAADAMV
jgi:hypothetical protein